MEHILCLKNSHIQEYCWYNNQKIIETTNETYNSMMTENNLWIGPRHMLEDNQAFRQLIPYSLIRYGNTYLMYTRTSKGGEDRLHDKLSLGIGGHINTKDLIHVPGTEKIDVKRTIFNSALREIKEEVHVSLDTIGYKRIGFIYTTNSAVDSVHFGIAFEFRAQTDKVEAATTHISDPQFIRIEELDNYHSRFEGWSQIVHGDKLNERQLSLF